MGAERLPPTEPPKPERHPGTCLDVLEMLERGEVHAILDATRDDVGVPIRFAKDPQLTLKFAWARHYPGRSIPDLEVDARGFRGTFSFGGVGSWVEVPWSAVYCAQGAGRQVTWHERIPLAMRNRTRAVEGPNPTQWPTPHRRPATKVADPIPTAGLQLIHSDPTVEPSLPTGDLRPAPVD